ncbi:GldL-related protein [Flavobacterium ammonificans]|jgi:hypothetical protein|uniref:GldL-related protein n=1 Tax=Flavobacterium ammonificans TaxID=1751056 RepID=UPI003B83680A
MENKQILNISLLFSVIIVIVGTLFKILHYPYSQLFLASGFIAMLVFCFVAISEIRSSTKINQSEKFMWIFGLIFISSITSLVYILSARKRIV